MTGAKTPKDREGIRERLLEEAWKIIAAATGGGEHAVASATLERAARIAGLWSEKPSALDPAGSHAAQVFTSEPLTPEQWSEKFAPKQE